MASATITKGSNPAQYNLVVTPVEGMEIKISLSKADLNSLLVDAKNILKFENDEAPTTTE